MAVLLRRPAAARDALVDLVYVALSCLADAREPRSTPRPFLPTPPPSSGERDRRLYCSAREGSLWVLKDLDDTRGPRLLGHGRFITSGKGRGRPVTTQEFPY